MYTTTRRGGRGGEWGGMKADRCDGLAGTHTETVAQSAFPRKSSSAALGSVLKIPKGNTPSGTAMDDDP